MRLRSPAIAILWEIWRVTRVEVAWKVAFGTVGGLAVLALFAAVAPADDAKRYEDIMDNGAVLAMTLLVLPHLAGWLSMAKLNGGRPGFPLHLHYTRPVRTAVIVGLPMTYLTAVSWAIYLVSALLLRVISGYPFPLLPVAVWIAALTLALAATWSARAIPVLVMLFAAAKGAVTAMHRLTDFPHGFRLVRLFKAVADDIRLPAHRLRVDRPDWHGIIRRHGRRSHATASRRRMAGGSPAQRGGLWDWLVNLFRFPCPTSSPTRAQLWLDLKSNGLPVLTIGLALAIVILLLSAVSGPIDAAINADRGVSCPIAECFYARYLPLLLRRSRCSSCCSSREMPSVFAGDKDARTSAHSRQLTRTAPRSWLSSRYS